MNNKSAINDNDLPHSRIIVSDEVFQNMLSLRESNRSIYLKRNEFRREQTQLRNTPLPTNIDPNDSNQVVQYGRLIEARRSTVTQYINKRLNRTDIEKSNGETGFNYFVEAITDDSLILLDEPENSLSAMWQMELTRFLIGAVRQFNCQFIIATHSPFLLAIPQAKIYNLDAKPIAESKWYELESMQCYYDLFKQHEAYFTK